jgi:ubiquinone/menaquinone biosynthesis C-methylase UbiE
VIETQQVMSRYSDWRHRIWNFNVANRDAWVALQAKAIPPGWRVLDVGAGAGRYRNLFSHCQYKAHDFGQEPGTIGVYTTLDYESDIVDIPVPDGSFDAILCTEVLEHVPEPIRAVNEMGRIIRPGGKLILTAPLASLLHQEPFHFYSGYSPHWYRKFLPEAGFVVSAIEPNQGFFSWYGQETVRLHAYLNPKQTLRFGALRWFWLTALWALTLPLAQLFPFIGAELDALGVEQIATVGYHVIARKRDDGGVDV